METKGDAGAGTVPDATSSKVTNLYVDYWFIFKSRPVYEKISRFWKPAEF
jgi:hypothetical protein